MPPAQLAGSKLQLWAGTADLFAVVDNRAEYRGRVPELGR